MFDNFYDRLREIVAPTYPYVVDLGGDKDSMATVMANHEIIYQCSDTPAGHSARVTQDATDTKNMNVGPIVPLSEKVI